MLGLRILQAPIAAAVLAAVAVALLAHSPTSANSGFKLPWTAGETYLVTQP